MRPSMIASLVALASFAARTAPASADSCGSPEAIEAPFCGTLLDFTKNSGCDHRIYSPALCEHRDLYVYLPPGYDPKGSYPLLIWLHSYTTDEREFAHDMAPALDEAIACGRVPPIIVAAPDGSLLGDTGRLPLGSWYVNSQRGQYADYILQDVLGFMEKNFAVCRDPGGRAIAGFSMGGFGAFSLGMKNPDKFKLVAGVAPALNVRYSGCNGDYFADFDPNCSCLRDDFHGHDVIGRFYGGLLKVRAWMLVWPTFGKGRCAVERASQDNPIELLERLPVEPGRQHYFVSYGKSDELNIDAQVESFLHVAAGRGIPVETHVDPCGDHSIPFLVSSLPNLFAWLKAHLNCAGGPAPGPGPAAAAPAKPAGIQPSPSAAKLQAVLLLPSPDAPLAASRDTANSPDTVAR